jgi:hypothetical protein
MPKILDFESDMPLSEWAQFIKDQAEDLLLLANEHEAAPTSGTATSVTDALDRLQALLRGARLQHDPDWVSEEEDDS